jgi:phosphate acetyltransferase
LEGSTSTGGLSARLRERARAGRARIVLPEGDDPRVVQAAARVRAEGIADPILLGARREAVVDAARVVGADLSAMTVLDPASDPRRHDLAARYLSARPADKSTAVEAAELLLDPLYFGSMLLHAGQADGLVAGAVSTTAATIEPALRLRRMRPGMGPITSYFLMELPPGRLPDGQGDVLVFADCALNSAPSSAMLARIAMAAAQAADELCGLQPRVALRSSSPRGSTTNDRVVAVRGALDELARRAPTLLVDGELQADAAIVADIAALKAPDSPVAGRANVLVFPGLESGNIAYKLVERLAGARAIGPIFAGLNWPVNDLSRGCGVEDIIDVVAVTAIQAWRGCGSGQPT